jgi:hypothetical protein
LPDLDDLNQRAVCFRCRTCGLNLCAREHGREPRILQLMLIVMSHEEQHPVKSAEGA